MGLFQWILLFGVMDVTVSQNAAVTYQYPVCDKFHTYETEYKTGQLSSVNTYLFEGSHPSVQCTPISFNNNTCTHIDLNVTAAVHFKDFTLSVFIYPESVTDNTIFHYRSADFEQHFVLGVKNGIPYLYIYKNEILVSGGKMDQDYIKINTWFFVALILKGFNDIELQIQLDKAPKTKSFPVVSNSVPLILNVPGHIRIGKMFEQIPNSPTAHFRGFIGQMICVQMYNTIFQTANYNYALKQCSLASEITITATTARTTCSPFNRNDSHFKKAHADRGFIPSINHLDEKINTTLRKCAIYCVRHLKCVSFTITKTEEEFQTCRLYDVYNKVYVENIATNTNMYVLNACH